MLLAMDFAKIRMLLVHQITSMFLIEDEEVAHIDKYIDEALRRSEHAFSKVKNKYYSEGNSVKFDPSHSCQWASFLYHISRFIYEGEGRVSVCDKAYGLIKTLVSADLYYEVALPSVFMFDHPLGSVIGRGAFSDYFTFSQGCTVGNNHGIYPRFGESVFMLSNSKVIGACNIGSNVIIGANAYVKDTDIPSGSLVFGQTPNLIIKTDRLSAVREYAEGVFRYE